MCTIAIMGCCFWHILWKHIVQSFFISRFSCVKTMKNGVSLLFMNDANLNSNALKKAALSKTNKFKCVASHRSVFNHTNISYATTAIFDLYWSDWKGQMMIDERIFPVVPFRFEQPFIFIYCLEFECENLRRNFSSSRDLYSNNIFSTFIYDMLQFF